MPGPRFVRSLSKEEQKALRELYRRTDKADVRSRCQMILLSSEEYPVSKIAELTFFTEDSILYWFARYEEDGLRGLEDRPRTGRRPKSEWPM
jgi:transposase